jgi:SAM-dependent methyltransferase
LWPLKKKMASITTTTTEVKQEVEENEVDNTQYKRKEYWNTRFQTEESYEWLCSYKDVSDYLEKDVAKKASVLILGCGNSPFSTEMVDAGYTNVTSLDFSSVVIDKMADKHKESHPAMKWVCGDVKRLDLHFERMSFDCIIDKACLDALVCDEGDPWSPNESTSFDMECALNSIAGTMKSGGTFLSIGFQQPHFRKRYLTKKSCSFGWESNITVHKIDCGLGYFYTKCLKDNIDHLVMPPIGKTEESDEEVVRVYTCVCGDLWHYGHALLCRNSKNMVLVIDFFSLIFFC